MQDMQLDARDIYILGDSSTEMTGKKPAPDTANAVVDLTLSDDPPEAEDGRVSGDSDIEIVKSTVGPSRGRAVAVPVAEESSKIRDGKESSGAKAAEEDIEITGTVGQVALRHLPHPRPDCGEHPILPICSAANSTHCTQCYCYVCDVPATSCSMWGTGVSERDHCNANKSIVWDRLKSLARAGRMAEVKAAHNVTAAPAAAIPAAMAGASGTTALAQRDPLALLRKMQDTKRARHRAGVTVPVLGPETANKEPLAAKTMHDKKLPSHLEILPDPALDPRALELGKFSFDVKAAKTTTMEALISRHFRTDFYARCNVNLSNFYDQALCLSNIFDKPFNAQYKHKATHLKLLGPRPAEDLPPLSDQRVRKVIVIDCLGLAAPVAIGVTLGKEVKASDVVQAARQMLDPPERADEDLVLCQDYGSVYSHDTIFEGKEDLKEYAFSTGNIVLYRIPKPPTCPPGLKSSNDKPSSSDTMGQNLKPGQNPKPKYVMIRFSRMVKKRRPVSRRADPDALLMRMMMGLVEGSDYEESDDNDEHHDLLAREAPGRAPAEMETYWDFEKNNTPIIMHLSDDCNKSGESANKAILDCLMPALRPFLKNDALAPQVDPFAASESSTAEPRSSPGSNLGHPTLFYGSPHVSGGVLRGEKLSVEGRGLVDHFGHPIKITAVWDESDRPCSYDTSSLDNPRVHPSAAPEILAETKRVIEEETKRGQMEVARKKLPYSILEELKSQCRRPWKGEEARLVSAVARVAVTLDLEATGGSAAPREGRAVFTVYAFRTGGPGVISLFQEWDNWAVENRFAESFPLSETMKQIIQSDPGGKAMYGQLKSSQPTGVENNVRSINGLLNFLQSGERTAARQPNGLTVKMRGYQLQSLQFMLDVEARDGGFRSLFWIPKTNSAGSSLYWYSPVFKRISLDVPEQGTGGFLAEEMGLGKTVEVLALILSAPAPASLVRGSPHPDCRSRLASHATLVVCAVSLVGQWVDEAFSKSNGSLKILQYHGQGRQRDVRKIASDYDLVVTTYQTIASDYGKDGKVDDFQPLGKIFWHRIVFDEGHMVKSGGAAQSKACTALRSTRRWCCTGTPIGTAIEDLLGQFTVIGMAPMNFKPFFDSYVKQAFRGASDMSTLLYTLKQSMIRHTKLQVLGGEQVLQLPPKTEEVVAVSMSAEERALYTRVHGEVHRKWLTFLTAGTAVVTRYQLTIMSLLGPLRRIASGGALKLHDLAVPELELDRLLAGPHAGAGGAAVNGDLNTPNANLVSTEAECSICLDTMEQPVTTPCQHWFCKECIMGWLDAKATCTLCRAPLSVAMLKAGVMPGYRPPAEDLGTAGLAGDAAGGSGAGGSAVEADPDPPQMCESKLRALLAELRAMKEADGTAKALVFSQYNTTLEWLKLRLTEEGFGYRTISGSMPLKQRTKAIEAFQKDPPTTVFLLSMRSGAVGINLTAASHVFIMEPCLNPALEEQAIGRSWRMGQQRSVVVKRFYSKGSVEEEIIKVVKARREAGARVADAAMASGADQAVAQAAAEAYLIQQQAGGARRRGGVQRVMADAVAGSIRSDKQALRMGELEMLFAPPVFTDDPAPPIAAAAARPMAPGGSEAAAAGPSHTVAGTADHSTLNRPLPARMSNGGPAPRGRPKSGKNGPKASRHSADGEATAAAVTPRDGAALQRQSGRKRKAVNYADMMNGMTEDGEEKEEEEALADDGMEEDDDE